MIFLNKTSKKKYLIYSIILVISFLLNSCGIYQPSDARKVSPEADVRARKAVEEGRGISIGNLGGGKTVFEFASSNPLWRATLEILDFLPLSEVDYSGGIVTTDWYNEGTSNNESIKITVRFLANEIRSDAVKIIVHKKACTKQQNCTVKKIQSALEEELKTSILRKAVLLVEEDKKKKKKKKKT